MYRIVKDTLVGFKAVAAREIRRADVVFAAERGRVSSQPSMHSIQVGVARHCDIAGDGRFLSHSETPNCVVRIEDGDLVRVEATTRISAGADLAIDYNATEWELDAPFRDAATGRECLGFKHLDDARKRDLESRGMLPAHILTLWRQASR
ncbi:hypothetical protein CTAYLR_006997 [Chrysophaeum taylorii]|uniref:SET domain-containing protein n=1 Tax=Chrysophaeum taylorii TaxID=2483200 RepID=A0AAD7XGT7_9STRA|nr:hypothetical protein CTAYLR_006997 [Chrysophaeum taylorii]